MLPVTLSLEQIGLIAVALWVVLDKVLPLMKNGKNGYESRFRGLEDKFSHLEIRFDEINNKLNKILMDFEIYTNIQNVVKEINKQNAKKN